MQEKIVRGKSEEGLVYFRRMLRAYDIVLPRV